jgi:hypothetical protein
MNNGCREYTKSHSFNDTSPNFLEVNCSICKLETCIRCTFVHPCTISLRLRAVGKCNNCSVALAMKWKKTNHMMTDRHNVPLDEVDQECP